MIKSEDENETKTWFDENTLITTVTGKTFKAQAIDTQVDVLMMVYADWCSHCKDLKPKFAKIAKRFTKHINPSCYGNEW